MKNIVNELLKTTSLATMAAAGCPLSNVSALLNTILVSMFRNSQFDQLLYCATCCIRKGLNYISDVFQGMLSLIAQGKYSSTIGHDKCQAFVCWLRQQDLSNVGLRSPEQQAETVKPNYLALPAPQPKKSFKPRITFSQNEIDTLTEWFNADERPSKEAMNQFTDILNIPRQMASIRLLTYESIYFWFKNKRSKKRKAESSLLEPWEPCYKNESTVVAPEVTMAIAPYAAVTTESTSTIVSTPRVTMETQEGSCAPISIAITNQSGGEVRVPINGLATMLAKCTAQNTLLDGGESSSKIRKIPKSRVTFDPQAELPFLNKWFDDEERPEKEVIEEYTNILNAERSPKSKRLLTPESIAMWFKNRRAKKRRTEISIDYSAEDSRQVVLRAGEENKQEEASDATSTITDETPDVHVPVEAGEENKHERASEAVTSTGMDETPDMHVAVDVTTLSSGS